MRCAVADDLPGSSRWLRPSRQKLLGAREDSKISGAEVELRGGAVDPGGVPVQRYSPFLGWKGKPPLKPGRTVQKVVRWANPRETSSYGEIEACKIVPFVRR